MLVSGYRVCTVLLPIYLKFISLLLSKLYLNFMSFYLNFMSLLLCKDIKFMSLLFILLCSNSVGNQCNCVHEHSALDDNILRWSYQVWHIPYCLVLVLLDISVHFLD